MQLDAKTVHAPEFGQQWINSSPLSLKALRGQVVLVDFWDYTCVNCIRTLPYLREWHKRYSTQGLTIVGVHAPEFYFASVSELVQLAVRDFGLEYPILLDNDYQIWQAFANRYWPAKYLIDTEGYIRYFHPGEGNYGETETAIQMLLRERNPMLAELPPIMQPIRPLDEPGAIQACQRPTPELYLGAKRGRIANEGGMREDERFQYQFNNSKNRPKEDDLIELDGIWQVRDQSSQAFPNPVSSLRLQYSAAEVNLVLAASAECPIARVDITENGKPLTPDARGEDVRYDASGVSFVEVNRPKMYSLIQRNHFVTGLLQLDTRSSGLEVFAFTFVSCI
jgi:thiol-disulfide isomerase/thioredoxin